VEKQSSSAIVETDGATKNPLIGHEFRYFGDRFRILESSRDTVDQSLRGDYFAAPGAKVPEHVHRDQEESFEVVSGTLGIRIGGRELILVGLRPGMGVEILLETLLGLSREGKTVGWMLPRNPLQLAVLAHEAGSWSYVTAVPRPLWKALFAPVRLLAFAGRSLGYRARYPEYSGPGQAAEPAEPEEEPYRPEGLLTLVSVLWLLNSALGAAMAIREDLPAEFAGMTRWRDPSSDFFRGSGTALSPGLPMMAAQAIFTLLSTRGDRTGTAGVAGMTVLGAGGTIGVLGEPITYRALSPGTFDPAKAAVAATAASLSALMALLGARRLLG
jgi:hypothetical protein